eukprot:3710962-Amphidinium_carterae.1
MRAGLVSTTVMQAAAGEHSRSSQLPRAHLDKLLRGQQRIELGLEELRRSILKLTHLDQPQQPQVLQPQQTLRLSPAPRAPILGKACHESDSLTSLQI